MCVCVCMVGYSLSCRWLVRQRFGVNECIRMHTNAYSTRINNVRLSHSPLSSLPKVMTCHNCNEAYEVDATELKGILDDVQAGVGG